jgi:AcrR family transcriptional regulator
MKISKQQKAENRQAIIRAAVAMIAEKGVKGASMRAIANQAGVADATIYNYFPTKDAIVFAYYEDHFASCRAELDAIADFNEYNLQERLQTLYETSLAQYLPDRDFVARTFKSVFFLFSQDFQQIKPVRDRFIEQVREMVSSAIDSEEIPDQVFQELLVQLFWDHYITMVIYWQGDTSTRFTNTSVMIDKSLDLACSALRAGVANKVFDLATFLFKNHVLNRMGFIRDRIDTLHAIKQDFTGGRHGRRDS